MGDVDHGEAEFLVDAMDLLAHFDAKASVEVAEGLVEENHIGFDDEGARERHTLLLAA